MTEHTDASINAMAARSRLLRDFDRRDRERRQQKRQSRPGSEPVPAQPGPRPKLLPGMTSCDR